MKVRWKKLHYDSTCLVIADSLTRISWYCIEDGRIYSGDWRHGRWHGHGMASFSNGDSYEGEYKFDQRHGRGIYKWKDGRVFDGIFQEDKRHGKGERARETRS